jgi:hypothetical protein
MQTILSEFCRSVSKKYFHLRPNGDVAYLSEKSSRANVMAVLLSQKSENIKLYTDSAMNHTHPPTWERASALLPNTVPSYGQVA